MERMGCFYTLPFFQNIKFHTMSDKNILELSVKILGEMMRSISYDEVPPQDQAEASVDYAIYMVEYLRKVKK